MKKLRLLSFLWRNKTEDSSEGNGERNETMATTGGGRVELVIGLDFGTSSSKVVVRAPDLQGSPAYPMDFGDFGHPAMPQLLPTSLWVDSSGICSLRSKAGSRMYQDLKIKLLSEMNPNLAVSMSVEGGDNFDEARAAAYLGLVLQKVRTWFLITHEKLVARFDKIVWSFNLGVPSASMGENAENDRFFRVGNAAWLLSFAKDEITIIGASKCLADVAGKANKQPFKKYEAEECYFQIIPEIAGGAISYAMSELRTEGLHLMLDFGASTVDACSFILRNREGTDRYSLMVTDVQPLGVAEMHRRQLAALELAEMENPEDSVYYQKVDPLDPFPEERDNVEEPFIREVAQVNEQFRDECSTHLRRVLEKTRTERAPNEDEWTTKPLPVLLIGGGSVVDQYERVVDELDYWFRNEHIRNQHGMKLLPMPVQSTPDGEEVAYMRLAVAYGLSYREFDIGEITPADRIANMIKEPPAEIMGTYIGSEQT
ncbi:hypothetical protein KQI63_06465 [bacterium]|nr:hypothetical protein [bacterium]